MGWLLLLLVVVAAVPFVVERRRTAIGPEMRKDAPGEFAELSGGLTHYRWDGPEDGPVLVCIHGLTTPSFVYDTLVPGLVDLGFRVLRYDLWGRGYSDRTGGDQTRHFFIRQLRELLQDQGIEGPVTVMGYSMGGSIATVYAAEEADRVQRLILLAPAGLRHKAGTMANLARRLPLVGDWLMLAFGARHLRQVAAELAGECADLRSISARAAAETQVQGYLPAVLSSQRNLLAEDLTEEHMYLAEHGLPVVAVWGGDDTVIPISAMEDLARLNPSARQAAVPGASHALPITRPEAVLEAIRG